MQFARMEFGSQARWPPVFRVELEVCLLINIGFVREFRHIQLLPSSLLQWLFKSESSGTWLFCINCQKQHISLSLSRRILIFGEKTKSKKIDCDRNFSSAFYSFYLCDLWRMILKTSEGEGMLQWLWSNESRFWNRDYSFLSFPFCQRYVFLSN